jgi:diadenosine tetraphosphate (Ap4A) HIT family hydrolase
MSLYYLDNSRGPEQTDEMVRLEAAGICIFCPEHLAQGGTKPILYQEGGWTVTTNDYPYPGTARHLLLVPDEHVDDLCELSPALQMGYWSALTWARDNFALSHYGLGVRNGDMRYTGGTIFHVHVHLVVGETDPERYEPIRLKLSSLPREMPPIH